MSCRDFWEYIYEDLRASNKPDFEDSLRSALYVFFEKGEGRAKSKNMKNTIEPDLTPFSVSEFQRERDVIAYCGKILDDLGGDNGPVITTLPELLLRIRKRIDYLKKQGFNFEDRDKNHDQVQKV